MLTRTLTKTKSSVDSNANISDLTNSRFKSVDNLPWVEKYRPTKLDNIVSHEEIISILKRFITQRCLPHLLFYGPSGTGKTSTIMACAEELYGKYLPFMVMELNASDDRGIEVVRNKIKQFVTSKNVFFGESVNDRINIFKLVILDEADAMTSDAQAILRKVVEKYTVNTRFCLICNYIQNISPALQSRCTRFRFAPISKTHILNRTLEIIKKENIQTTPDGIETIIQLSDGDMRKVLNNLQSVSMAYDVIDEKNVNTCLGYPRKCHIHVIMYLLIDKPFSKAYSLINTIKKNNGLSITDLIKELHDILVNYILTYNDKQKLPVSKVFKDNDILDSENESEFLDNIEKYDLTKINLDYHIRKMNLLNITKILDDLRLLEYNQSVNTTESIQMAALIGVFKRAL